MAIFKQSKPSFWSLNGRRGAVEVADEPESQTSPDVSARLGDLMSQIDAGISQSNEREKVIQAGRRRAQAEAEAAAAATTLPQAATAVVQAAAATAAPRAAAAAPQTATAAPRVSAQQPAAAAPQVAQRTAAPAPAVTSPVKAVAAVLPEIEPDPETDEALRAISEQRKAAEKLLMEACVLEERIKKEAAATRIVRAYEAAEKQAELAVVKAQTATAAEEEAKQRADGMLRDHMALSGELKSIEASIAEKRSLAEAANAKVEALEKQLLEARHVAETAISDTELHESRKRECSERETAAARAAAESAARIAARKAEREAAEAEEAAARERVVALKAQLPSANETDSKETVARLAARIAEQVKLARNSHTDTVTAA